MPQAAVAADFGEPLDVHSHFPTQVTLDGEVVLDSVPEQGLLVLSQILHPGVGVDLGHLQNLGSASRSNAVDISQCYFHPLLTGKVDTRNSCHLLFAPPN